MEDPRIGQVLDDRFRILQRLAAGGTGIVYRAEEVGAGKTVAIKLLYESSAGSKVHRRRFEREAAAMSRLTHRNVASIIGYGTAESRPYLVMEMVEGDSLRRLLEGGALSARRAVDIARQILAGLAVAHRSGVVHRDLKPGNVALVRGEDGDERVKILDFGVAKLLGGPTSTAVSVVTGKPLGTPEYMSPEQAKSEAVDARADLYSVGIILYEMVTGRRPFAAETGFAVLRQHVEDDARAPRRLAPHLSAELEAVILRAMSKDPALRWQSAVDMAEALAAVPELEDAEPGAGRRRSRGRGWRLLAAGLALIGATAGAAWLAVAAQWIAAPAWLPGGGGTLASSAERKAGAFRDAGVEAAIAAREAREARPPPAPPWFSPPSIVRLGVEPERPIVENRGTRGRLLGRPFAPGFVRLDDGGRGRAVRFSARPPDAARPCSAGGEPEGQRSLVISLPGGSPAFAESEELSDVEGAAIEARIEGETRAVEGRWSLELRRVDAESGIATGRIRLRARGGTGLRGRFRGVYCPGPRRVPTAPPEVNGVAWDPDRAPAPDALPTRAAAGAFGDSAFHPVHANLRDAREVDGWILSFFADEPVDPCRALGRDDEGVAVVLPREVLHEGYEMSALLGETDDGAPWVGMQPERVSAEERPPLGTADVLALRIDAVTYADLRGRVYAAAADRRRSLFTGAFRVFDCRR